MKKFESHINSFLPVKIASFKRSYGSICVLDSVKTKPLFVPEKIKTAFAKAAGILNVEIDLQSEYNAPFFSVMLDQCFWSLQKGKNEIVNADCIDHVHMQKSLGKLEGADLLSIKIMGGDFFGLEFSFSDAHCLMLSEFEGYKHDSKLCVFELDHRKEVLNYSKADSFYFEDSNWGRLFHSRML